MPQPLTPNQIAVLVALEIHGGGWHPRAGWMWRTESQTRRVCESLVNRGLVSALPWSVDRDFVFVLNEQRGPLARARRPD